jgi:hypothetical protein
MLGKGGITLALRLIVLGMRNKEDFRSGRRKMLELGKIMET